LAGGRIEALHNLPAGQTRVYDFDIRYTGNIRLEIARDIENGKNDKGSEKEKGSSEKKSGQGKTTLDSFGGGTIDRTEAADSDTVSDSRSQSE